MKGSKTRKSGRVDLLVRMPPELKKRIAEAAQEGHESLTDWVLVAIEARLAIRDEAAQKRKDIEGAENRQTAKYDEILALLAAKRRAGGLAKSTGKGRIELEDMATSEVEKWKDKVGADHRAAPKNELEQLCH